MQIEKIERVIKPQGLVIRGAFDLTPEDRVPALDDGKTARSLVLLGNAGSSIWQAFSRSPEYLDQQPDSLDRWSRRLGESLARQFDALALFPFGGPPHHPFLSWSRRGDPVTPSPVFMFIHPEYGLWHAYRFALAFATPIEGLSETPPVKPLCEPCHQPCLTSCPVQAFTGSDYRVDVCADYLLQTPAASCHLQGCAARHACPQGIKYRYQPEHARFHMQAFVESRARYKKGDATLSHDD